MFKARRLRQTLVPQTRPSPFIDVDLSQPPVIRDVLNVPRRPLLFLLSWDKAVDPRIPRVTPAVTESRFSFRESFLLLILRIVSHYSVFWVLLEC
jgi:hypothetical protein